MAHASFSRNRFLQEEDKPGWSGHFLDRLRWKPMITIAYYMNTKALVKIRLDATSCSHGKDCFGVARSADKKYERPITTLDQIPDEELDMLAQQGFTGLWLIGIWERSWASKRIKQINGNPEAAASAYSLHDYDIAEGLGGWEALENLRTRLWYRGFALQVIWCRITREWIQNG